MHQLTETVKVLQKVVLFADKKVLILKRADTSTMRAGQWDLPGGNSEWPESTVSKQSLHTADIVRETSEETGITIAASEFSRPIFFDTYFDAEQQLYSIIVGWRVLLPAQPQVRLSLEHTEFAWILPAEFPVYDFGFAGKSNGFIRQILNRSII
ncbi:MAG: hypothetical protein A3A82_00445 [Candidatus Pacebacteria bacterium RIFCSPLOWO2_01_FULL_47_12]|nr:MAG: hypothetical protein A3A82_00445 [Candidatus Pacebacteria bacterium RIFCSPLOWO2_01_FULL_47_12]